jgi:hypothetical protein
MLSEYTFTTRYSLLVVIALHLISANLQQEGSWHSEKNQSFMTMVYGWAGDMMAQGKEKDEENEYDYDGTVARKDVSHRNKQIQQRNKIIIHRA